ncbi:MAG: ABC transporter ATP-binding protein [Candidatus Hodarchaeales archaeon]|jgi:ATP-binding cassette subfamily B protein
MTVKSRTTNTGFRTEFTLEKDPFEAAREKGSIRWIIAHLLHGSNKWLVLLTFFGVLLSTIMASAVMVLIGMAIDDFATGSTKNLNYYAIVILLLGAGGPVVRLFNNVIRETIAQRVERDTRHEFYTNLLSKSQSFHDQQKIGDIMARTTNDVRMLNFLVSPALSLIFESFTGLIVPILFIALFYPTELLLTPILYSILFLLTLRGYNRKLGPVTAQLRSEFGLMNAVLNETLSGIDVVKGSTQEAYETERFFKHAKGYRDAFAEQGEVMGKYIPLLLVGIAVTLGIGHGILLHINGSFGVGAIIGYAGLLWRLRFPTFISIWVFAIVRLAHSGAERLLEIMKEETDIYEDEAAIEKELEGTVKFENVSFFYPGSTKKVLSNLNFEIKPGQSVAIVGTTGSGKTTLTKLITRLYDVSSGQILVDGIDVRGYKLQSLRSQVSYIEQDVFLFSTSIFENIAFGQAATLDEVVNVAKEAQADEFISALPEGYESEVGERGVTVSGGERQRIAIARAFLTNPRILILDDSTSAIDSETEDRIQQAIHRILRGRTTFLITHRLSQIRWADLIIVMKRGEIVAKGNHEELLQTSDEYRKIYVKRFDLDETQLLAKVAT